MIHVGQGAVVIGILQAIYALENMSMVENKSLCMLKNAWGRESGDVCSPRDDLLADFEMLNFGE